MPRPLLSAQHPSPTYLNHWQRSSVPGSGTTGGQSLAQACTEPIAAVDAIHYDIMITTSPQDGRINCTMLIYPLNYLLKVRTLR
jgi:hypothetical protein